MEKRHTVRTRLGQVVWVSPGVLLTLTGAGRIHAREALWPAIIILIGGLAMILAVLWDAVRRP
jgi:hypothetical protein